MFGVTTGLPSSAVGHFPLLVDPFSILIVVQPILLLVLANPSLLILSGVVRRSGFKNLVMVTTVGREALKSMIDRSAILGNSVSV